VDVPGHVGAGVHGRVPAALGQLGQVAVAVAGAPLDLGEQLGSGLAAVEDRDVVAGGEGGVDDVPADEPGATDHEDAHVRNAIQRRR
jgi:hypothetical protein